MTTKRGLIKFFTKLGVGVALVVYLLQSNMIHFESFRAFLYSPRNLAVAAVFFFFSAVCCALRWYLLSRVQGLSLSRVTMFELIMIGNFFNTFMPGSVGGDVIKAWYVAGREPSRKMRAVFTMFLDRVVGLAVIVFYSALTLLFYTGWLSVHPELKLLGAAIWGFTAASLILGISFFALAPQAMAFYRRGPSPAVSLALARASCPQHFDLPRAFSRYSCFARLIRPLHSRAQFTLQDPGDQLGIAMDLAHYFFVVPITMTVSAIPILPGGIGVGQVAFYKLFQWIGMANPEQGATLCTVMQVYTIFVQCCTGAFFYLKFKRQPILVANEEASTQLT